MLKNSFCESNDVYCSNLKEHLLTRQHKKLVANSSNFKNLADNMREIPPLVSLMHPVPSEAGVCQPQPEELLSSEFCINVTDSINSNLVND